MYEKYFMLFLMFRLTASLYEDQIGKFDWRQQYVGQMKEMALEKSSSTSRQIFLATEPNIVGSVNFRTGDLVWRQVMEEGGKLNGFAYCDSVILTLSQHTSTIVRAWNTALGHLLWEAHVSEVSDIPVALTCDPKSKQVFVLYGQKLSSLDLGEGTEMWNKEIPQLANTLSLKMVLSTQRDILIVGLKPNVSVTLVTIVTSSSNKVVDNVLTSPWLTSFSDCILMAASESLICVDQKGGNLYSAQLISDAKWKTDSLTTLGLPAGSVYKMTVLLSDYVTVTAADGTSVVMALAKGTPPKILYKLAKVSVVCAVQHMDQSYLISGHHSNKPFRNLDISVFDLTTGSEQTKLSAALHIPQHHGRPERMEAVMFPKKDGVLAYRLLIFTEDHAIQLFQQTGKSLWLREESLASIASSEMVDLPVSEHQAKMEDEFGHNQGRNVIEMFVKRITTQLSQLKAFIQEQVRRQQTFSSSPHSSSAESEESETERNEDMEMTRDDFNIHKIIVIATTTGKLFGMETFNGRTVWKYLIPEAAPYSRGRVLLFLQRTTAHFPLPPQCTVIMRHKSTLKPLLFAFNPVNGVPVDKTGSDVTHLSYDITQAVMLSVTSEEALYLRPVLLLDKDAKFGRSPKVHIFPANFRLNLATTPIFLHSVELDTGRVIGYRLREDTAFSRFYAEPTWRLSVTSGISKIIDMASRSSLEHIHSVGRILGDRSVLYKYLNPNLIAILTETVDKDPAKCSLNLYVIDTVVGRIVHSAQHKRAGGPVNVIHSENWIIYTYHNHKSYRFEVAVIEMFERSNEAVSVFSSFNRDDLTPDVIKQAYILGTPVRTLAVSLTEKGITAKSLIMALNTGGVMEMPKSILDPRRPLDMTLEHQEEGLEPYMPELPLSTLAIVSYNQSIQGVRGIHTAPSGLESTSLVFVYGFDLFFTRVSPSKMYDVLKEDFDYFFIGTVTVGMIVASFVTQRLAARKALFRAWQ